MTSAKPAPNNYHTVTPYILVQDADKLIDFVKKVFGAKETERITMYKTNIRGEATIL